MPRQAPRTSITDATAAHFASTATERQTLGCTKLNGFHLIRLAKGCAWRYRYSDSAGKRRVVTLGSYPAIRPAEAADKVAAWSLADADPMREKKQAQADQVKADAARDGRTLRKYLDGRYGALMEKWGADNARATRGRIIKHFGEYLDRPLDDLNHDCLTAWQIAMEKKGAARGTIERTHTALRAMLNQAVKHRVIEANPLAGFKLEDAHVDILKAGDDALKADRRMLTPEETTALFTGLEKFAEEIRAGRRNSRAHGKPHLPDLDAVSCPHWFIPFCHIAFHTGLRVGDIVDLTWDKLNVPFRRLRLRPNKTIRRSTGTTVIDQPLNDALHAVMHAWWSQCGKPQDGLVFVSPKTGKALDPSAHKKPWARVKALGGLDDGLVFYSLRHNFVSTLITAGLPILTVAKLVGHKSGAMIEAHYHHLCRNQATDAVDILSRAASTSTAARVTA